MGTICAGVIDDVFDHLTPVAQSARDSRVGGELAGGFYLAGEADVVAVEDESETSRRSRRVDDLDDKTEVGEAERMVDVGAIGWATREIFEPLARANASGFTSGVTGSPRRSSR